MQNNPRSINEAKKAKLEDALKIIRDAASDTKDELYELLDDKYEDVRTWFEDIAEESAVKANRYAKKGVKVARGVMKDVNNTVSENPWPYLGGAALAGIVLGYLITRRD